MAAISFTREAAVLTVTKSALYATITSMSSSATPLALPHSAVATKVSLWLLTDQAQTISGLLHFIFLFLGRFLNLHICGQDSLPHLLRS